VPKSNLENIRHSLAHLLAAAVLKKFPGAKLGIGPTIENGFYYDFLLPRSLSPEDLKEFEKTMRELIRKRLPFKGGPVTDAEARKLFADQPFKLDLIREFSEGGQKLTIYKTGDIFTDLCRGGHVKSTSEINPDAFRLTDIAAAYWHGDENKPQLQRIYGVAFKNKKELEAYLKMEEEAKKRDHRKIGAEMDLFSFHGVAPGAVFWHGKGMIIFRELEKLIREELDNAGYEEISTPIMVKKEIFEKSGHWKYYRENMFYWTDGNDTLVLKPMNCPESTYIYNSKIRSYKDLPLRLAEIGRLHRNERSGTLGGLLRVRAITMDDAHIYLRPDQIKKEISALLKLVKKIYGMFGFKLSFRLATMPDSALGNRALWNKAETALKSALKDNKTKFEIKPKDGAFYGPKIDVHVKDAIGRDWQLATIQLDLAMLPEKFNLVYTDEKGRKQKPVVIHRAIFGSFERFLGVLIEHTAGNLPTWLAPVQARIAPVSEKSAAYAKKLLKLFKEKGIRADLASESETLGKNIRAAEMEKIPYIVVVGEKEMKDKNLSVRERHKKENVKMTIEEFLKKITDEIKNRER